MKIKELKESRKSIRNISMLFLTFSFVSASLFAQISSSNLPIIKINTYGNAIPDEPKIDGEISILYNGPGQTNFVTDSAAEYFGKIRIEQRGETSQNFDKKSWSFKLIDSAGQGMDAAFLNFPAEEDWVLYGPYSDKTFLRNVLTMKIGREMGSYHSRTRVVEVILNDNYRGVYVLMERLKRDKNRLDLPKMKVTDTSGMQLTGGYIFRIDKGTHDGWNSQYDKPGDPGTKMYFQYFYPKEEDIVPQQKQYIKSYVDSFELALSSPNFRHPSGNRYNDFIEFRSFFDFFIINEVANNIDGYRLSSYFHKNKNTKDGLLHAGPFWDFNLSYGNGNYCEGDVTNKWQYLGCAKSEGGPFWWEAFISDTLFTRGLRCRWDELRQTTLSTGNLMNFIDSMQTEIDAGAATRNYNLYKVLGKYVWPNPKPYYSTYAGEVDDMQNWLSNRLTWLDSNMPGTAGNCDDFIPCYVKKGRFAVTACDSYTVPSGDETYTTAGIYTLKDTITSSCGMDSLLTIDLTLYKSTVGVDTVFACESYTWINGKTYTADNSIATDTIANASGCDSIITLHLTILSANTGTDEITACGSFTWTNGITYTTTNNTAKDTLSNFLGCDSVITLNLTINDLKTGVDTIEACTAYTWRDGIMYTSDNSTAIYSFSNPTGCDSVITLNLTIKEVTFGIDTINTCSAYTWRDGITYTESNTSATDTLLNIAGCDSIVTLNLNINYVNAGTDSIVACNAYTWIDGNTYTSNNNTASHILSNKTASPLGCDSIITLNLTMNTINAGIDIITACGPYTWRDGITYTASNNTATHLLANANGCDSALTLELTINHASTGTHTINTCKAIKWIDGNTYTSSNHTATHALKNWKGCDSLISLDLNIHNINAGIDYITTCTPYTWKDGITYSKSNNTATYVFPSNRGCDSVLTLNLKVNAPDTSITLSNTKLISNEREASYRWLNCNDNYLEVIGETFQTFKANQIGSFAVELSKGACVDTSACKEISPVGINENNLFPTIGISPNPTSGSISISLGLQKTINIVVYSLDGRIIYQKNQINTSMHQFEIRGEAGIYFIEISSQGEQQRYKLIKN